MKRIIAALAAVAMLTVCFTSCQLSELINKNDSETTPADNAETTPADAQTTPAVEYEPVDFNEVDPLQYITLGQYKGVAATITYEQLTDEAYDAAIASLMDENSYYTSITDRATAKGDVLNMDYKGFMEGEQFEGGTASGQTIKLSEDSGYIAGFADGLVGVMPGDTVVLELTFPEDYYEDIAGKPVTFEVTVNYIQGELVVPELDAAFVTKYTNGDITGVEAFEEYYRKELQDALDEEAKTAAMNDVWSKVVENTVTSEYPEQHVMYNYNKLIDQYNYYASYYGVDLATVLSLYGLSEDDLMLDAQFYTKQDMVLYAIIRQEGMTLSDDEYTAELAKIAESVGATAEAVENYYGKDYIKESILWNKVLTQLYDWAEITEVRP